jgi:hypothetical protein
VVQEAAPPAAQARRLPAALLLLLLVVVLLLTSEGTAGASGVLTLGLWVPTPSAAVGVPSAAEGVAVAVEGRGSETNLIASCMPYLIASACSPKS